jgi:hypothetical protein
VPFGTSARLHAWIRTGCHRQGTCACTSLHYCSVVPSPVLRPFHSGHGRRYVPACANFIAKCCNFLPRKERQSTVGSKELPTCPMPANMPYFCSEWASYGAQLPRTLRAVSLYHPTLHRSATPLAFVSIPSLLLHGLLTALATHSHVAIMYMYYSVQRPAYESTKGRNWLQ